MKLTFLLPALLAIGVVSGSALGAPDERESYKRDHDKRVEYKRDERRHEKKQRIEHKKEKREDRKQEKRKLAKYKQEKREQNRYNHRKYSFLTKHHNSVAYKQNRFINHLPRNSASIRFNGISFTFNDGLYYRKAKRGYHAVNPPRGLRISALPRNYRHFKRHNTSYYTYQNVYYIEDNNGYIVVDEPKIPLNRAIKVDNVNNYSLGQTYDSLPLTAEAVIVNSQQYFKYGDIYFLPQISGDEIKYLAIKLS
ncbi:hypothetical protein P20652_0033 [Pseudoalteromonas sp. BSi20652]|uniref:DUF6515 family protein n=1 Tax=Pseudoalteromonas sp. BSi20652 TaxID=388384 RepID=UPI00023190A2|nr:DUF6515 family protein [Pseudoalteromonas sp. BSi20652]GAA58182.1 hypothetical protein P20652_0033 [Pseudoalteromonas sp. BSi20652]